MAFMCRLMYASQSFSYIRNMMLLGLAFAFSPALLLEALCIHASAVRHSRLAAVAASAA